MAIEAIVLAAGRSRRYGRGNKLLARVGGRPLLEYTLAAATASRVRRVTVVTGYQRQRIERAVRRFSATRRRPRLVHNTHYRAGLSSSLRAGLSALPSGCEGVIVCLGDIPGITASTIDRLLAARTPQAQAVRPAHAGRPGHPVLLLQPLFADLRAIRGDRGAGAILNALPPDRLVTIESGENAVADIDRITEIRYIAARQ